MNLNERDFEFSRVKKDERKLPNERGWHGGWDNAEDVELEKWRGNLDIEDGAGSKMIILFLLKAYSHISIVGF